MKARVIGPMEAILSATATNARLFRMEDSIGKASEGMDADLIAVSGDPISDIGILANGKNIPLVIKAGQVFKESL